GADGKRPPVGFIDLTLSAPKSLSVAWALASTADEREQLLGIHRTAVEKTMQYVAEEIGHTRRGGKNNRRTEPGDIAWIGFHHYTARPVGQDAADPQIHTHNIVLPHVLTESGHIGALDRRRGSNPAGQSEGYLTALNVEMVDEAAECRTPIDLPRF